MSNSRCSYLQFKHPVLTLGLLRRLRFLGASLPLPLALPLSLPITEVIDWAMPLEGNENAVRNLRLANAVPEMTVTDRLHAAAQP
jgi:hypothetical protein